MSESLWTLEDGTLHIQLTKAEEGATWDSAIAGALPGTRPSTVPGPGALIGAAMETPPPRACTASCAGHELQEDQRQADQKRLLLERFQAEVGGCRRGDDCWEMPVLLLLAAATINTAAFGC